MYKTTVIQTPKPVSSIRVETTAAGLLQIWCELCGRQTQMNLRDAGSVSVLKAEFLEAHKRSSCKGKK